jgi:two-component system, sensor histidine kinase
MNADARVLVWAYPRDTQLTCAFLEESGFGCHGCRSWQELAESWGQGAGVLVLAGELLTASTLASLEVILRAQPPWSDPPIVIVGAGDSGHELDALAEIGNVALLQRPLSLNTLRSTVRAAMRARRRQYQVRDLLQQKEEAERRKDEFLAMLAHELRNPLAPLRTGLQLLRLDPTAAVVARTLATMERQIRNLTRLVDDLLDVSRITRRTIALRKTPLDVREPVRQAVDAVQHVARESGLAIDLSLPDEPVMVDADSVRLEQMIGNLLSNAIKFTPEGGAIRVSVCAAAGVAEISVADTGVGIAPDQVERLFDLFAQAPRTLDRTQGGLGIGLTIVKLLAELHGGTAEIASRGEGSGTEVRVHLPRVAERRQSPEAAGAQETRLTRATCSVLIVEDNHDVAETLAVYLEHLGHHVVVAHDGHAGLEAARRHRPQVLICDIGLPGLNGYEIAGRLRADPDAHACLMIAITGYGDAADREKTRAAGFAHHLTKPADPAKLARIIATALCDDVPSRG